VGPNKGLQATAALSGNLHEGIQHMETTQTVKILGRFIVADPRVCHGQPTFRGTRVFVADVLDQVARGLDWETIIEEWHGSITHEAIAEAVHLAAQALLTPTRLYSA
jgi:uncharacterized protein (DUF433 family)